ncbi:hypothetical protein PG996_003883 [Apiospora saccharicola]|uniref:DUF6594 domain-containing protein n=1 Tax=Apiospora saccharicola TaxID=335842 RepID=A0ABR1W2L2_9PEZI
MAAQTTGSDVELSEHGSEGPNVVHRIGTSRGQGEAAQQSSSVVPPPPPGLVLNERTGYSMLADFISRSPENAIFRKFGLLNMINLLRLQAELVDLEQQLDDVWSLDRTASNEIEHNSHDAEDRRLYGLDFWHMRTCKEERKDSIQLDLLEDIGKKLDEYTIENAVRPQRSDHKFLEQWLLNKNFLRGYEGNTWSTRDQNPDDFITIAQPPDKMTSMLSGKLLDLYDLVFGGRRETVDDHARAYSPRTVSRVGSAVVAALSSTLPTLAILVLYFVGDMVKRLGLVIIFTTLFAVALAVFTDAKKVEIFSATAAFAAVEVVYIGSTSGVGGGNDGSSQREA